MSFIQFHGDNATEILRLSKDGITANPDVPADDAARLVLAAIDGHIKEMVNKAVAAERDACAKVCEAADKSTHPADLADAIRARGQA